MVYDQQIHCEEHEIEIQQLKLQELEKEVELTRSPTTPMLASFRDCKHDIEQTEDYDLMKDALLKRHNLLEDVYYYKLCKARPKEGQTSRAVHQKNQELSVLMGGEVL